MLNNICKINAMIPSSGKTASIELNNRNLIITGVNGCGKTQFINKLFEYLDRLIISRQNLTLEQLESQVSIYTNELSRITEASGNYQNYNAALRENQKALMEAKSPPVFIDNIEQFTIDYHNQKAVLLKFEATRQASIRPSNSSRSKDALKQEVLVMSDASTLFEDYLVSQKTAQAFAESPNIGNNPGEAKSINAWFEKLESDLQELFEDTSLKLHFEYETQSFYIRQQGKAQYRLQQLSSGFSSIFSIYATLLTKIQLSSSSIDDIYGVVLIDEIDAHLHVSLQRKILSFLTKSFPKIQFVVSTHSPFVVSSVREVVIYDLSTLEQVEDLSMYSYESILSGLFNTAPVSEVLKEMIVDMGDMMLSPNIDISKLEHYVREIGEHEQHLDSESAFFVKKARLIISKNKKEGV
ncbi:Predicted ATP-binding protein involved in virulence [Pseudomonas syringae]|uniref:AAA ATPase n=1 Tax=Pseudomonas syringae pv. apii TaxID=81036 RepID=A0A3M3RSY6_9PSED|nr:MULTISPECIES: AAA family ATPase [Pseudomonas syringae group]RMN44295.1 AAA ATPase [Pseudomonas syringae pv. apii]RMN50468.1 AAA ATPase [Pseudomonas syringae pv. apii]RMN99540.1 AAA ATPase [Pseudomonas syringae pv. apii]SDY78076.1 Predicted ATP-binding protein involved in virulence [Pseudomonas syringae]